MLRIQLLCEKSDGQSESYLTDFLAVLVDLVLVRHGRGLAFGAGDSRGSVNVCGCIIAATNISSPVIYFESRIELVLFESRL